MTRKQSTFSRRSQKPGFSAGYSAKKPGFFPTPQRVTILNTYSWFNKGDSAIVLGTVHALRCINPDVNVTIVSQTPQADRRPYAQRGVAVVGGPFGLIYQRDVPRVWRLLVFGLSLNMLLMALIDARILGPRTTNWLPGEVGRLARALTRSDLVISCGGGFWHDSDGGLGIRIHLPQLICAYLSGAPFVCLGQTLGPFRSGWRRWLVGMLLNKARLVVIREPESLPIAHAMSIDAHKIILGTDMAFALASQISSESSHCGRPQGIAPTPSPDVGAGLAPARRATARVAPTNNPREGRLRIGVTARAWWFPGCANPQQAQQRYEQELATALDAVISNNDAEIVFLPQVIGPYQDDDRIVHRRIAGLLYRPERAIVLDKDFSPEDLIAYIGGLDVVIATRFHSAILAMLANVPVLTIAYEHKTTGIMRQMGLSKWVTTIEQVTADKLVEMCALLLGEYEVLKEHLARAVGESSRQAHRSMMMCVGACSLEGNEVRRDG